MLFATVISVIVYTAQRLDTTVPLLPFSVAAILGSALAIFIAFRNNNAYSRWWEARTLWGGIINSSRILARLIITFTDSHRYQQGYNQARSEQFKQDLISLTIAWAHSLRLHLRNQTTWQEVLPHLPEKHHDSFLNIQHKPNYIQLLSGQLIYEAMGNGTLGGFDSFQMEGQLAALANYQGGCERIKNTPLLRQYDYFTRLILYTFILLIPFALVNDFNKLSLDFIPYLVVIAVGFFIQGLIKYVGNGDSEEKRSEGRKMMIYGITGFFFMVSIWGILQLFTASFGLKLLIPQFNSDQTFKCDANVGGGSLNTINSNGLQGIHDLPNKNQIQA